MWIVSQDRKTILEAVRFERFGPIIEVTGLGGFFLKEEYGSEYEAMTVMDMVYAGLNSGCTFLELPLKGE